MNNPSNNLMQGVRSLFPLEQFGWDGYACEMADADVLLGRGEEIAAKSFFVRNPPFGGAFTYLFGVVRFLRLVSEARYDTAEFAEGMRERGRSEAFIEYMRQHGTLKVRVYAPKDGTIFGPQEPIITVVGFKPHVRLVEGMMNVLNPGSLLFTKWRRGVLAGSPQIVAGFDRRRAQNPEYSALASLAAGVSGSSNEEMLRHFNFNLVATMGHEWMMGFDTIEQAFDAWLTVKPHKAVGLIDTHKVMEHDFPAWLDAVYKHRAEIKKANPATWGWRNDSGDLAYLTLAQWKMFLAHPLAKDPWFVERARIFETNDLDEHLIGDIKREILDRANEFGLNGSDVVKRLVWACGTKPGTAFDQPSLGGVAKIMQVEGIAKIKLAFNAQGEPGVKTSIPGFNLSAKILDEHGQFVCFFIFPADKYTFIEDGKLFDNQQGVVVDTITADHPTNPGAHTVVTRYHAIPQQELVFDTLCHEGFMANWPLEMTLQDVQRVATDEESLLDRSSLRLNNPHVLKVSLDPQLYALRMEMIAGGQLSAPAISEILL